MQSLKISLDLVDPYRRAVALSVIQSALQAASKQFPGLLVSPIAADEIVGSPAEDAAVLRAAQLYLARFGEWLEGASLGDEESETEISRCRMLSRVIGDMADTAERRAEAAGSHAESHTAPELKGAQS